MLGDTLSQTIDMLDPVCLFLLYSHAALDAASLLVLRESTGPFGIPWQWMSSALTCSMIKIWSL